MRAARARKIQCLLVIAAILSAGCDSRTTTASADRSILTGIPCTPPCWQGIIPGQTTCQEAIGLLTDLDLKPHVGVWECNITWFPLRKPPSSKLAWTANWLDGFPAGARVAYLRIGLEFKLTAEDVLERFGPPERYQVRETLGTLTVGGHTPIVELKLYYLERGLIFVALLMVDSPVGAQLVLQSSSPIDSVYYLPPTTTDRLAQDCPPLSKRLQASEPLLAWDGFPIRYEWTGKLTW